MSSFRKMSCLLLAFLILPIVASFTSEIGQTNHTFQNGYIVAGRAERKVQRAPRDFGTFDVDCSNSAAACNNACYYINCMAGQGPDANKIVYGAFSRADSTRNRQQAGCQAARGTTSSSVCRNFPFSQKFISDQSRAPDFECDEWPPAASVQDPFSLKKTPNSLRCITKTENRSLGAKLGNWFSGQGNYPGRLIPGGMAQGDYFRITFNIQNVNPADVSFCLNPATPNCSNDGYQFEMTQMPTPNGQIDSFYNRATNNHYSLSKTVYKDIYQCSVEVTRDQDNDFSFAVFDLDNHDVTDPTTSTRQIAGPTGQCIVKGLPNWITMTKTGTFGMNLDFQYANVADVPYYTWNSESTSNGFGEGTSQGEPRRYCGVTDLAQNKRKYNCWFPCYEHADGM